jgi:FADH2 O2-dependent halogenase
MKRETFQVVVIGSGFAGSLMAMIVQRLGFSTALLERGRHPRFVIGESSTPLANLLLEEIATEYELPSVRPLCKWGPWQEQLSHIPCGLKRGFTFYHHQLDRPFLPDPGRQRQLLVGASPNEEVADTHWYRPQFDQYLVEQAQALGVAYLDEVELSAAAEEPDFIRLKGRRHGHPLELSAEFVVDATGPRGFLHRSLGLPERPFPILPPTQALFSHFTGVRALPAAFHCEGRTPPYPPEQAAVHHVFPGGWIWVLKFNNGITSAGVAATDEIAHSAAFHSKDKAWLALLQRLPSLDEMFASAQTVLPFVHQPRLAFQSAVITGARWALLPSAAGVIDPLLSTGFPLALLGIGRLAQVLRCHWRRDSLRGQLDSYAQVTALDLQTTARLVGALYANMGRFEIFKQLNLLYFAAAIFSETARRSGQPAAADSFLLCRHPSFYSQLVEICELAAGAACSQEELMSRIQRAIKPFDLTGLTDPSTDPWHAAVWPERLHSRGTLCSSVT